jgi:hypothetical protein
MNQHPVYFSSAADSLGDVKDKPAPYTHPLCPSAVRKHLAVSQVLDFLVGDAGFEPTAFGSGELYKMQINQ